MIHHLLLACLLLTPRVAEIRFKLDTLLTFCVADVFASEVAQRTAAGEKTSPFQGVMWDRQSRRWHATLHLPNDNRRKLGKSYVCETAAAKDWDKAVRELLGKDAHGKITMSERALKKRPKTWLLNFPTAAEAARLQEQQATKEESKRQHAERTRSNRSKYIGA
jgi:hypothetical protein